MFLQASGHHGMSARVAWVEAQPAKGNSQTWIAGHEPLTTSAGLVPSISSITIKSSRNGPIWANGIPFRDSFRTEKLSQCCVWIAPLFTAHGFHRQDGARCFGCFGCFGTRSIQSLSSSEGCVPNTYHMAHDGICNSENSD